MEDILLLVPPKRIRTWAVGVLKSQGYRSLEAHDSDEALRLLLFVQASAVVAISACGGWEALAKASQQFGDSRPPFVILSWAAPTLPAWFESDKDLLVQLPTTSSVLLRAVGFACGRSGSVCSHCRCDDVVVGGAAQCGSRGRALNSHPMMGLAMSLANRHNRAIALLHGEAA